MLAPRSCPGLSPRVQQLAVGSVGGGGPGPCPGRQEFLQLRALLSKPFSWHLPRGHGVWQSPASHSVPRSPRLLPRRCQSVPSPALVFVPACAGHLFLPPPPGGSWCCPRLCLGVAASVLCGVFSQLGPWPPRRLCSQARLDYRCFHISLKTEFVSVLFIFLPAFV